MILFRVHIGLVFGFKELKKKPDHGPTFINVQVLFEVYDDTWQFAHC